MKYQKNDIVKGEVTGIQSYGIFVDINKNYKGLIHISQIDHHFIDDVNDFVKIGEEIYCEILDIDANSNQLSLSIKNIDYHGLGNKISKNEKEFECLKKHLDFWIEEKLKEINDQKKN